MEKIKVLFICHGRVNGLPTTECVGQSDAEWGIVRQS